MLKNYFPKAYTKIFLGAITLSVLFSFCSIFLLSAQNVLVDSFLMHAKSSIASFPMIIPRLLLGLIFYISAWRQPLEKVFRGSLIVLILGLIVILVYLKSPFITDSGSFTSPMLLAHAFLRLFNFSIFSLLIWGFVNRVCKLELGKKLYIPLGFFIAFNEAIFGNFVMPIFKNLHLSIFSWLALAIATLTLAIFVFNCFWKNSAIDELEEQTASINGRFPIISAAYLITGSVIIKTFLDFLLKTQVKTLFPTAVKYQQFILEYSQTFTRSLVFIGILWFILGTWLVLKKGWKTPLKIALVSILLASVLFINFAFQPIGQGMFQGFLNGTSVVLFFPFVQLLYLHLPFQRRLKTKVATEMIAVPLMNAAPALILQGLIVILGSIAASTNYVKALIALSILFICFAAFRIQLKAKAETPQA
jgi:ATP/ADP translocase